MVDANRNIEDRLDRIEKLLTRGQKETRRDLGLLAAQAQITDLGMTALLCGACVIVVAGVKVGVEVRESIQENAPGWLTAMIYPGLGSSGADNTDATELKVGDTIGSFKVTSAVGPRNSPGGVGSTNHQGVDIATSTGTPIYASANGRVECISSSSGGTGARFDNGRGVVTLWHLSACDGGDKAKSDSIGKTGNSGAATTGPHLHFEIKVNGAIANPQMRDVAPVLGVKSSADGKDFVSRYVNAIAGQESGDSYTAVNQHSGALGKYQFMPATLASTAQSCPGVGNVPSVSEFLGNPELQDTIMGCYTTSALPTIQAKASDEQAQCRMLAAFHYSGNPDKWDDGSAQSYAGAAYPSIAEYTKSVCKGFR